VDLNYLYQRHQVSIFRAVHAASAAARRAHRGLADGYAVLIAAARTEAAR
jgi:hypothetical protein